MTGTPLLSRRLFVAELGRAGLALAVIGVTGCATTGPGSPSPRGATSSPGRSGPGSSAAPSPAGASAPAARDAVPGGSGSGAPGSGATSWHRVNLGFVSAYVLARAGEAAIVDTGVGGSEDEIAAALEAAGLGWSAVGHVILTHRHPDHAGSAGAVLDAAPDAQGYAGAEDLAAIAVPRPLVPVADGDRVFDLRIVATPGHTPGHVAVFDEAGGILVAGDALGTSGGGPTLPNPQFTEDMDLAQRSVAQLGLLEFETLLVGHGDPIESGASAQVRGLAGGG